MLPSLTVSAALPITPNNRSVKGGRAKLGQYERARQLAEDTLTRMRRVLGDDHPDTLHTADTLAGVLRQLGQYEPARQLAEDTLTRMRRVLGDDHPDTERLARNLAAVLASLGEHDHACWLQE